MDKRRMCPHCRAFIKSSDRVCPYCENEVGPRAVERHSPQDLLGGLIPHAHFTTTIILLVNFGLFAATALYSMRAGNANAIWGIDGRTLAAFGGKWSEAIQYGQWWRLVTAGFLHGGALHIFMNSWALFDLGAQVEEVYGARRFLVFYFISTVTGFYVSYLGTPSLSVGASAGLFGLIGAMIALGVRDGSRQGSALRGVYVRWAIYGLAFGLMPGIDNYAHIGGLAAGFAVAYIAGTPKLVQTPVERLWQAAAGVCLLVTAFCFVQMFRWFAANVQ